MPLSKGFVSMPWLWTWLCDDASRSYLGILPCLDGPAVGDGLPLTSALFCSFALP